VLSDELSPTDDQNTSAMRRRNSHTEICWRILKRFFKSVHVGCHKMRLFMPMQLYQMRVRLKQHFQFQTQ